MPPELLLRPERLEDMEFVRDRASPLIEGGPRRADVIRGEYLEEMEEDVSRRSLAGRIGRGLDFMNGEVGAAKDVDLWWGPSDEVVPRVCCGGLFGVAGSDALGGGWRGGGDAGFGLALTRFCSRRGRKEETVGDVDGLGRAGTGGAASHVCSPRSVSATGWLQLEHLTVGRSWEMRLGSGAGASREAMGGG